jgi:2-polyprenyl-3-methyl-5-hydroxy-6-metoxy-1,4-benzoquinol methylase
MNEEKPPRFYKGKGYLKKGKEYGYRPLYRQIFSLLPLDRPLIIDLGCGVGYFARFLSQRGYKRYIGIDFSQHMINLAKRHAPEFEYILRDLYSERFEAIAKNFKLFTIIETLEHIEDDMFVLEKLPKGSIIVGSVPNTMSMGHVRVFNGPKDVSSRYSSLILFDFFNVIILNKRNPEDIITVFRGKIK